LNKIRQAWSEELPKIPETALTEILSASHPRMKEINCCFWLFRWLHRVEMPTATLLGDYCFGRFSHHLAALDNVAITDAFSDYLRKDTLRQKEFGDYLAFIRTLSPDTME